MRVELQKTFQTREQTFQLAWFHLKVLLQLSDVDVQHDLQCSHVVHLCLHQLCRKRQNQNLSVIKPLSCKKMQITFPVFSCFGSVSAHAVFPKHQKNHTLLISECDNCQPLRCETNWNDSLKNLTYRKWHLVSSPFLLSDFSQSVDQLPNSKTPPPGPGRLTPDQIAPLHNEHLKKWQGEESL